MDLVGNRNLRGLLDERTIMYAGKVFLVFEDKEGVVSEYTYHEFSLQVDAFAAGLHQLGVDKGDRVTVHLSNSPEILISWFALATIGAIMVPSNTANTISELTHILSYSESVAVITQPSLLEVVQETVKVCPSIKNTILARSSKPVAGTLSFDVFLQSPEKPPKVEIDSEDVMQILFTSGTTARPKGVQLTHANALRSGERSSRSLGLDSRDRCMTSLPIFHVNAQSLTVLAALTTGGTCVILEEYRASKFWTQVRFHRATQTSLVAMQARTLLAQPLSPLDSVHDLRRVFYAINIPEEEKVAFEGRFAVELINGYGLSEAMTLVTLSPIFGPKKWPSIGLPVYDRQVRLVDSDGNDVPVGEPGEIIVHGIPGRTLMKGYYKDPEATSLALRDNWLYTGDNRLCG